MTYADRSYRTEYASSFELLDDDETSGATVEFFNGYQKESVYFPLEELDAITDALIEFRRQVCEAAVDTANR